jgi:hypothetical protein
VDALRSPVDESIYACRLYDFACIGAAFSIQLPHPFPFEPVILFVLLSFFFLPLCCLFFFEIQILIAPLVSSNSSYRAIVRH